MYNRNFSLSSAFSIRRGKRSDFFPIMYLIIPLNMFFGIFFESFFVIAGDSRLGLFSSEIGSAWFLLEGLLIDSYFNYGSTISSCSLHVYKFGTFFTWCSAMLSIPWFWSFDFLDSIISRSVSLLCRGSYAIVFFI